MHTCMSVHHSVTSTIGAPGIRTNQIGNTMNDEPLDPKTYLIDIKNSQHRAWMRRLWVCLSDYGMKPSGAYEAPYFDGACITGIYGAQRWTYRIASVTFDNEKQSPFFVAQRCMNGLDDTPYLIWSAHTEIEKLSAQVDGF